MEKENLLRLKKYIFFISVFFLLVTGIHLAYLFLLEGSSKQPVEGGIVSEGIILDAGEDFPHLNPLLYSSSYNDYIIKLLYRSLMTYDNKKKKYVANIANCDTSNLLQIKCYLKDNLKWANGENITVNDVLATFNLLKNTKVNTLLSSLLKETTIDVRDQVIYFNNSRKDVNFLQIFDQGILPEKLIKSIGGKTIFGKFNPMDGIYSGKYVVENVSYDEKLGFKKLILTKNDFYENNDLYIKKLVFKFFKNVGQFLKNKEEINIFYDDKEIVGNTLPRLKKYNFYKNSYVTMFLNSERLSSREFRNFVLSKINKDIILNKLGEDYIDVKNPFLGEMSIKKEIKNNNLQAILKDLGYYKKTELESILLKNKKKEASKEQFQKENTKLKYISSPLKEKYTFRQDISDLLLKGIVLSDENPEKIFVGNYELKGYKKGGKKFFYRLKEDFKNIKKGRNDYNIYFQINGEKILKESFTIFYDKDKEKLLEYKEEMIKKSSKKITKLSLDNKKVIDKIKKLNDLGFYDKNLNKFSLKLLYLTNDKNIFVIADTLKNVLLPFGIPIKLEGITLDNLNKMIKLSKKDYDMVILGIDLKYNDFNNYPYFHSSQANSGYNLAKIKNLELDIPLEELKSKILPENIKKEKINKVLEILKREQIVYPFYNPPLAYLIDENIIDFKAQSRVGEISDRFNSFTDAYVAYKKQINYDDKTFIGFLNFLKEKLMK